MNALFLRRALIPFFFLLAIPGLNAQMYFKKQIDSLELLIQRTNSVKEKNILWAKQLNCASRMEDTNYFYNARKHLLKIAQQPQHKELLANIYQSSGISYYYAGNYPLALRYFDSAAVFSRKNNYEEILMGVLMSKGAMHYTLGDYYNSLSCYLESERLMIKYKSEKLGGLYSNISMIYNNVGDPKKAEQYLRKAIPFTRMSRDNEGLVKAHNNLGLIEKKRGNFARADSIFREGLKLARQSNLEADVSDILYNLADVLLSENKKQESIDLRLELFELVQHTKEFNWQKTIAVDLAISYYSTGNIQKAKEYLAISKSLAFNEDVSLELKSDYYKGLADITLKLKDYKASAEAFAEAVELIKQKEIEATAVNLQKLNYQHEKQKDSLAFAKEKEINDLQNEKEKQITEHKLSKQRVITGISIAALVIIAFFAVSLFRANKQKEAANLEILSQKQLITAKNKEITDSINYALRIQRSLLPTTQILSRLMPQHFLIYLPKDIVSGDFYWTKEINENEFFIAAADCTGHGVPGAIMSALSIQQMNEISETEKEPGELLNKLNKKIIENLNQEVEGFSKDGLDIAVCKVNLRERKVYYSGANRSLWVFNAGGLKQEIKATKAGIAGHNGRTQNYAQHEVSLESGDLFVMSTDGYADQFGGEKMKKLTTKHLKVLISQTMQMNTTEAEGFLKDSFLKWKNTSEQIDDVCLIGFKFV